MNIGAIVKDSLKYPLSDWKNYLIYGIIIVFANSYFEFGSLTQNSGLIIALVIIWFIMGLFAFGYMFKIIKSSLKGVDKLPEFNNFTNIVIEGAKVFIVYIVYLIPVILIVLLIWLNSEFTEFNLISFLSISLPSKIWPGITGLSATPLDLPIMTVEGVTASYLGILYTILVIPIMLIAIANMAYYKGELKSGFKIREIYEKISHIGWKNLIKWYITTGIIFLVLFMMVIVAYNLFYLFHLNYLSINEPLNLIPTIYGFIIPTLIISPYTYIFISRSVALFYMLMKKNANPGFKPII